MNKPMTVAELRKALAEYPDDWAVVRCHDEFGTYDYVCSIDTVTLAVIVDIMDGGEVMDDVADGPIHAIELIT